MDIILTGASRGIGRAFALALAEARPQDRLVLVARDRDRLETLAREIAFQSPTPTLVLPGDLGSTAGARTLGAELAARVDDSATLVHNAGLWPTRRIVTDEGLESAFVVNYKGPLTMQEQLLDSRKLRRIMVVGAGIMALGRFDPKRTPIGDDFSRFRTYATTKLCFALAMRDIAEKHPELDVVVVHPGVVRTDLGAMPGSFGFLLDLAKRRWEAPADCAKRLVRIFGRERWSPPGEARFLFEEEERAWPKVAEDPKVRSAVLTVS